MFRTMTGSGKNGKRLRRTKTNTLVYLQTVWDTAVTVSPQFKYEINLMLIWFESPFLTVPPTFFLFFPSAGDKYDSSDNQRDRWDEDWEKKGQFPFSEKLGEISDKIGSTIDDTISKFRKKDRDDSPDRIRWDLPKIPGLL